MWTIHLHEDMFQPSIFSVLATCRSYIPFGVESHLPDGTSNLFSPCVRVLQVEQAFAIKNGINENGTSDDIYIYIYIFNTYIYMYIWAPCNHTSNKWNIRTSMKQLSEPTWSQPTQRISTNHLYTTLFGVTTFHAFPRSGCQGWSTPYIGDPNSSHLDLTHPTMRLMTIPFGQKALLILADPGFNHDPPLEPAQTFSWSKRLFREVFLRCDTVKLEKKVELPDHASGFPFFLQRSSKVCQQFLAWPRCANDSKKPVAQPFILHLVNNLNVHSDFMSPLFEDKLVGGFKPFDKYFSQWIISWTSGAKIENVWNHHLATYLFNIAFIATPLMREAIENNKRPPEKIRVRFSALKYRNRETT